MNYKTRLTISLLKSIKELSWSTAQGRKLDFRIQMISISQHENVRISTFSRTNLVIKSIQIDVVTKSIYRMICMKFRIKINSKTMTDYQLLKWRHSKFYAITTCNKQIYTCRWQIQVRGIYQSSLSLNHINILLGQFQKPIKKTKTWYIINMGFRNCPKNIFINKQQSTSSIASLSSCMLSLPKLMEAKIICRQPIQHYTKSFQLSPSYKGYYDQILKKNISVPNQESIKPKKMKKMCSNLPTSKNLISTMINLRKEEMMLFVNYDNNNIVLMLGRVKKWVLNETVPQDKATCIFCNKTFSNQEPIHYQDEKYFVITDINQASSVKHILVITKEHIQNALHVEDPSIIKQMRVIGQKVLNSICDKLKIEERKFRFGFHLPPVNSIDHLHLHCFIEPLQQFKYNRLFYGFFLNSVQKVLQKLQQAKK